MPDTDINYAYVDEFGFGFYPSNDEIADGLGLHPAFSGLATEPTAEAPIAPTATNVVSAVGVAGIWRVVNADGSPVMSGRSPSDGGGLPDAASAWRLADTINQRRARKASA